MLLWRDRFESFGMPGLMKERKRSGRPSVLTPEKVKQVVEATLRTTPPDATQWSVRTMAEAQRLRTPEQRERVENDISDVLHTKRGQEIQKEIERQGKPVEVRLNDEGRLSAPTPGAHVNVDPESHPKIMTRKGPVPASTRRIIAHELGHAVFGTRDAGPGRLDNVNQNENPVAEELGEPPRTRY